jgi:Icc-related predicted phosphoesterase
MPRASSLPRKVYVRIHLLSDLHLEFCAYEYRKAPADVVCLAGDIAAYGSDESLRLLDQLVAKIRLPVVYVPGNHEYYGCAHRATFLADLRKRLPAHVHLLDREQVVIGGVRFLGCTLWTGFSMLEHSPTLKDASQAMIVAQRGVADFRTILSDTRGTTVRASEMAEWHAQDKAWLAEQLKQDTKTVVVTHFCPTPACVDRQFYGSPLNPYFSNDLRALCGSPACAWLFGHTHSSFDFEQSGTRLVCNPRGYVYPGDPDTPENEQFRDRCVVEV